LKARDLQEKQYFHRQKRNALFIEIKVVQNRGIFGLEKDFSLDQGEEESFVEER